MTAMKRAYEVGDECWIHFSGSSEHWSRGTVVHRFTLPEWTFEHYVIRIDTHIDPIFEVRCAFEMSDAEDQPIGLWRTLEHWAGMPDEADE